MGYVFYNGNNDARLNSTVYNNNRWNFNMGNLSGFNINNNTEQGIINLLNKDGDLKMLATTSTFLIVKGLHQKEYKFNCYVLHITVLSAMGQLTHFYYDINGNYKGLTEGKLFESSQTDGWKTV